MANLATNPWGVPNSAAIHSMKALKRTGAASTLTPAAQNTSTTANVTTAEAMNVPVLGNSVFAVGDVVMIAGSTNSWIITSKPDSTHIVVRRYHGVQLPQVIASGAVVTKQTVS